MNRLIPDVPKVWTGSCSGRNKGIMIICVIPSKLSKASVYENNNDYISENKIIFGNESRVALDSRLTG